LKKKQLFISYLNTENQPYKHLNYIVEVDKLLLIGYAALH